MTEAAKRYLELLNEMEWIRATSGLSRPQEIARAAQLDRIWSALPEAEQDAIEQELQAIDARAETSEYLCDDQVVPEGSDVGPRRAA